ncbi:MAG TPA: LysM domain-containing protein [Steroidobacteraceae bacterium]|nr:LysM domain-containing protein [Steroidobacteraceae bacterium]
MTATEAAIAGAPGGAAQNLVLNPNAPGTYTVKRGDTLWGIASMYLKDPWLWPQIWVVNPQIPNPHLIYPGDILALSYTSSGQPQVMVVQGGTVRMTPALRSSPIEASIPTISYGSIAKFISKPSVLTKDQIKDAPYVLAFRDMHQTGGGGMEIYIRNLKDSVENSRYAIMHVGSRLVDPDDGAVVGYSGIYTGTALIKRPGEPAKAAIIDTARETLGGDRLLTTDARDTPLNFELRAPTDKVRGRIIEIVGGTGDMGLVGQYSIVIINRGARDGLVPGNVLAIDQAGWYERDYYRDGKQIGSPGFTSTFAPNVRIPDEPVGTMLIFKVFERVSYGLVVGASDVITVLDYVHNP